MTRKFNQNVGCPYCHRDHTIETAFSRWMRKNPRIGSSPDAAAIVSFDCDVLLHKYLTYNDTLGSRDIQAMMFIEVKTFGAEMTGAQRDTLGILNQILRNRKGTPNAKKRRIQASCGDSKDKAWSKLNKKWVIIRLFGGHLLQFSGQCPITSQEIEWDRKPIKVEQLVLLLRFELDPDTLMPIDWRRHHRNKNASQRVLFKGSDNA